MRSRRVVARRARTAVGHMLGMEENIMVLLLLLLLFALFTASVDDDRVLL